MADSISLNNFEEFTLDESKYLAKVLACISGFELWPGEYSAQTSLDSYWYKFLDV
jgi:hypothetical protein